MNILSSMLNYLLTKAQTAANKIGTATMTTTATTLTGAVNELNAKRRNNLVAAYLTEEKALVTAYTIVPMGAEIAIGSSFVATSDGGYRALRTGTVLVSASCGVKDLAAADVVLLCIGRYNGGWVYESAGHFALGSTTNRSCDISTYAMYVNQNDVIYIRARNVTAARGSVSSARIVVEYI